MALGPTAAAALGLHVPGREASNATARPAEAEAAEAAEAAPAEEAEEGGGAAAAADGEAEGDDGDDEAAAAPSTPTAAPSALAGAKVAVDAPPRFLRMILYHYDFAPTVSNESAVAASPKAKRRRRRKARGMAAGEGAWWRRQRVRTYLPAVELANPSLQSFLSSTGWASDASYRCGLRLRALTSAASSSSAAASAAASTMSWCTADGCRPYPSLAAARDACAALGAHECEGVALVAPPPPPPPQKDKGRATPSSALPPTSSSDEPPLPLYFETRGARAPAGEATTSTAAPAALVLWGRVAAPEVACARSSPWTRAMLATARASDQELVFVLVALALAGRLLLSPVRMAAVVLWRAVLLAARALRGARRRAWTPAAGVKEKVG